jgi:hypothetical protein
MSREVIMGQLKHFVMLCDELELEHPNNTSHELSQVGFLLQRNRITEEKAHEILHRLRVERETGAEQVTEMLLASL